MNALFTLVRDAELRRYRWDFATRRTSLSADGSDPEWGDWNRFSVPNDYLALIRDDESGQAVDWRLESGEEGEGVFIVTADEAPLDIRYVARVEDPNVFDPLFVVAFASRLALEACEEVTGSTTKKAGIKVDYEDAINEARRAGAIEKPAQEFPEDEWVNARL